MRVERDYWTDGYAHVHGLLQQDTLKPLLALIKFYFDSNHASLAQQLTPDSVLTRPALQAHSAKFPPLDAFLWGLTPAIGQIVGKSLLPTYCYFRVYRGGDVCLVHSDRSSCEFSMSLTLAYSDGKPWAFEIAATPWTEHLKYATPAFPQDERYSSIVMQPGDGVLYQGSTHNHGRVTPNPNTWSAHLFLHWVDADGPMREFAFDKRKVIQEADFSVP